MPVTIRPAAMDDVAAILDIEQPVPSAAHWTPEQYATLIQLGKVLLAEEEGVLCGFLCARGVAGEWEIENVVVAESFRRRGIAATLLRELLRQIRLLNAVAIWLEVRESNLPARRFYEKNGFVEGGRRLRYYRDPSEDALMYQLKIVA